MIFSTALFFGFFLIIFIVHWFVIPYAVPPRWRLRANHAFLLSASYLFYMSWDWRFGFLMAASTILDYGIGRWLGNVDKTVKNADKNARMRRRIIIISVVANLGILAYFKYADFFIGSFVDLVNVFAPGAVNKSGVLLRIILPLGISFITFMSMSYTIDVYRRIVPVETNLPKYALFVSFFPHLVAGPILVAKELLPQFNTLPEFNMARMREAARWLALGFFKKVVLADNLAPIVDKVYSDPSGHGTLAHWVGAWGFWVQVYCDFSGYSDMAYAFAMFLGYRLTENFRLPYLSRSVTEHWQRWHISLIRWIRDYLYIPLGGNRVSFWRHKFNVWLTMFLAGLWHGANWTFLIWGSIHGLILVMESSIKEKFFKSSEPGKLRPWVNTSGAAFPERAARAVGSFTLSLCALIATTCCTVVFGTMFRAQSIHDAWLVIRRLLGIDFLYTSVQPDMYRPVILGVIAVYVGHIIGYWIFEKKRLRFEVPGWVEAAAAPVIILILMQLGQQEAVPFIYFVF